MDGEVVEVRSVTNADRHLNHPAAEVGGRIRQAIKATGLRQGDVAAQIGVSERTVGAWVAGDTIPEGTHLAKLAVVTGRSARWIIEGGDDIFETLQELRSELRKLQDRVTQLEGKDG